MEPPARPAAGRAPLARVAALVIVTVLLASGVASVRAAVPSGGADALLPFPGSPTLSERLGTLQPASDEERAVEEEAAEEASATAVGEDGPPEAEPGAEASGDAYVVEEGELRALRNGEIAWTLPLPLEGGPRAARRVADGSLYVAHGLYLLEVDAADGTVLRRIPLPAPATEILGVDGDAVRLTVGFVTGDEATITVPPPDGEPVRFGIHPPAFGWLRDDAAAREAPVDDLEQDPTHPWLAFAAARAAEDEDVREARLDEALESARALPFFESAHLALALAEENDLERARTAMEAALRDFASRDYDPRLLHDPALRDAYGLPFEAARNAAERGDIRAMEMWAPFVWRLASEEVPDTIDALTDVSAGFRETGERDAADLWRNRAADLGRAGLSTWLDGVALALGRFGLVGVAALLIAFVLTWLTLLAKVWRAQSLARTQRRERAEPVRPWSRLWVPRQASTTEKLSLILILVLAGFLTALAGWAARADGIAPALRSGTLASFPARQAADALPDTPHADFARGVSFHVRGLVDEAEAAYRDAGEVAGALVNLGLLLNDDALFQSALRVDPRQPVARFHLGRAEEPSPFHAAYVPEEPLLAVPSRIDFALASAGTPGAALGEAATAPWRALPQARPAGVPAWAWWIVLVLYALLLLALVLQLFVARPRVARDAPRTPVYHPLALLVPGSGHLDELWGLLLLVPWALFGLDALVRVAGGGAGLPVSLRLEVWIVALAWAANLAGYVVELASYRRRMRLLRDRKPELARSYGLPPRPVKTDA